MAIDINVEIEVDELVSSCRKSDKSKLLRSLLKNMDNEDIMNVVKDSNNEDLIMFRSSGFWDMRVLEANFNLALLKLAKNYLSITIEDQTTIENIANKY